MKERDLTPDEVVIIRHWRKIRDGESGHGDLVAKCKARQLAHIGKSDSVDVRAEIEGVIRCRERDFGNSPAV